MIQIQNDPTMKFQIRYDLKLGEYDSLVDSRDIFNHEGFSTIAQHIVDGRVILHSSNNAIYNNGYLRASQMAIRELAFLDALDGRGHPDIPIGMLVRDVSSSGRNRYSLVVLNGHHRTGVSIAQRQPFYLEIVAILDEVSGQFIQSYMYDFTDEKVLSLLGLEVAPNNLSSSWSFNVIVSKIRERFSRE